MDVYHYKAALWCGPCIIKTLIAERKAAPSAIDMPPAEALEQIVSANGFINESDYDSHDLPKGPYTEAAARLILRSIVTAAGNSCKTRSPGMGEFTLRARSAAASPEGSAPRPATRSSSIGRNSIKASSISVGSFLKH
jgi:hypothetical protein